MKIFSYAFIALLCLSCSKTTQEKTLTLAHSLPISHPVHKGIVVFQQELKKLSKGKLDVKIYPDGQLGDEREALELLQIGSISMTKVSAATMANFVPEYGAVSIPYIFRDKEHCFKVLEGEIGKTLLQKGDDRWLRGLCFYDAGSRSFYTTSKPIESAEDVKGLKIRVMNDPTAVKMVSALGGSPTPMAYGELYTALQQGVVDGAENNIPSFVTSRHFEVCKYYSYDEHTYIPDVLIMGTKTLNRLTNQEKEWVYSAAKTSAQAQKKFWENSVNEGLKVLKEAGVQIYRPDKTPFRDQTKSIIEEFKNKSFGNLVEAIQNTK
ncbi:tripartite ATP-independent transporter DctP family solute receptor [Wenyingzhuangia heitensis]|uniref:Tripartite ATP-independent transporter DctP family solute receptor n=1 Tax=Wenyingzhuangia heitensis TaxID=1487859 RepID=A0ABX0UGC8_9FLAO|nr:TRAP transporter substrate-binding protein [Wenyingzhuangia heitensis]NIJ46246.1 tripartite ATP-independent transporter DctP family solute receptor [Wenyingzhuangia heitensis]